jgi:Outer membrane protein beta-barrel domain
LRRAAASALVVLLLAGTTSAKEPRVEVAGYAGYTIGGSAEGQYNCDVRRGEIQEAPSYGAMVDVAVRPGAFVELSYSQQDTDLVVQSGAYGRQDFSLQVHYLQLGGLLEFRVPKADWFRPIFGLTAGATVFDANDGTNSQTEWRFSAVLEGGAKFRIIDQLGVRLRARMLTTFLPEQSALFCGTGTGCALAYQGTAVIQGDFGAGIYVAF